MTWPGRYVIRGKRIEQKRNGAADATPFLIIIYVEASALLVKQAWRGFATAGCGPAGCG
jgi:hypothetical protein